MERFSSAHHRRHFYFWITGVLLLVALLGVSLSFGSVKIPIGEVSSILLDRSEYENQGLANIIWSIRFPKALTAVLAGAALAVAGLQMQTLFRNPLADPFVLGVNSGASLGVAIVVLVTGPGLASLLSGMGVAGNYAVVVASSLGSAMVLTLIMVLSFRVDLMTLLIVGLMMGYATSALVMVLVFFAIPERLQTFFAWGYGNLSHVTWDQISILAPVVVLGILMAWIAGKAMNAFLLGEAYARSMGVSIIKWRTWVLISTSLLTGVVVGFCGPVGFIGVAVPHLCRSMFQTSDHRILYPAVILYGGLLTLMADFIAQVPGSRLVLPLNSITSLIGAPVVIWILLGRRSLRSAFGNG